VAFNWRSAGEVVAVVSVVISVVFVGYELRAGRSIAINESFAEGSGVAVDLGEYLSGNSEVWLKGCSGEELSIEEEFKYLQLLGAWDAWNFARWQRSRTGISLASPDRWVKTAALNMYRHEGFKKYWRIHQSLQANENAIVGDPPTSGYGYDVEVQYREYSDNDLPKMYSVSACGK